MKLSHTVDVLGVTFETSDALEFHIDDGDGAQPPNIVDGKYDPQ